MDYKYKVGFARIDITPKEPIPLGGYGNPTKRISRATRDNLFLSCYALTDQNNTTVLLMNFDGIVCPFEFSDFAKEEICKLYGIPEENVHLAATHSHSTPDTRAGENAAVNKYNEDFKRSILLCAGEALNDRTPAKILVGEACGEGLNFVRHYKANPPDGSEFYFGDNMNDHLITSSDIVQKYSTHATKINNTVYLLKFERENAKDLIIANWRAHATLTSGIQKFDLSADFPGETRKFVEENTDCFFTYFQGDCGNGNAKTRINDERITEDCTALSKILAERIIKGLGNLEPVKEENIKADKKVITVNVNHLQDSLVDKAKEVWDYFVSTGSRPKGNELGRKYGFHSIYHAAAVRRKSGEPQTLRLALNAFTIGNIAFITCPNEIFDTTITNVRNNCGYDRLFMFGYCDGNMGYVPTKQAFEYGCYEADNSSYAPGTAEQIGETFLQMLKDLK